MRNKHKLFWMVYVIIQSSLFGQNFLSTVKEDSVFIFLTKTPAAGQSVIIERQGPQDSTFIQLNKDPIQPVLSVDQARRLLGADYQDIADALHTENMQQTLFLLRNDLFTAAL